MHSTASVPDLIRNKAGWFSYFDQTQRGLSFEQLMQALSITPSVTSRINIQALRQPISELWLMFDHDRSGMIGASEFLAPGALADSLIAQLVAGYGKPQTSGHIDTEVNGIGSHLAFPPQHLPPDFEKMVQHVMTTLPGTQRSTAEASLRETNYNPDLAVQLVIKQRRVGTSGCHQAISHPPTHRGVNTNTTYTAPLQNQLPAQSPGKKYPIVQQGPSIIENFRCFHCHLDFSVDLTRLASQVELLNSTCPTCGTVNQVRLSRPRKAASAVMPPTSPQALVVQPPVSVGMSTEAVSSASQTQTPPTYQALMSPTLPRPPVVQPPVRTNISTGAAPYASQTLPPYHPPVQTQMQHDTNSAFQNLAHIIRPMPGLSEQIAPPSIYSGCPPPGTRKKRALLIGINYYGQRGQLKGCLNDVNNVYRLLVEQYGWSSQDITVLIDGSCPGLPSGIEIRKPTRVNIISRLKWLAGDCCPGDALFLLYSGHGAQVEDPRGIEEDGMNETILPVDFASSGQITDDEISSIIVQPLPEGVRLTAVMDCCHSGTGLDLPYTWTTQSREFRTETNPYHTLGDVQLFSGCEDDGVSADASLFNQNGGAMTTAFCEILRANPCPTYVELLVSIQTMLNKRRFKQRAQLSSSQVFDIHRPFILDDAIPNGNKTIGQTIRCRFPPQKKKSTVHIENLLGMGAMAALGGFILEKIIS